VLSLSGDGGRGHSPGGPGERREERRESRAERGVERRREKAREFPSFPRSVLPSVLSWGLSVVRGEHSGWRSGLSPELGEAGARAALRRLGTD